jgi:hypothetical protein
MGRPTQRGPATVTAILDAYAKGLSLPEACERAGVNYRTGHRWLSHPAFSRAAQQARARRLFTLRLLVEHSGRDWKTYAWILERLDPLNFGDHVARENAIKANPEPFSTSAGACTVDSSLVQPKPAPASPVGSACR